jgi:glycosyltransferase involved in cell wall biosynthesis
MAKTIKLAINGRFLTQRMTGVQRYAREVIGTLDRWLGEADRPDIDAVLILPPGAGLEIALSHIRIAKGGVGAGYFWEQVCLPILARDRLLLNLCNLAPVLHFNKVSLIHDAAPASLPQAHSRAFRFIYSILIPLIARTSRRVLTVSEFSKREIARHYKVAPSRIAVIKGGGDHIARVPAGAAVAQYGVEQGKYFLAVGSSAPHKNLDLILKAFGIFQAAYPGYKLVVTGARNDKVFASTNHAPNDPNVVFAGHVDDATLRALYESAAALLFPSLYEGLGLPPLEAMMLGTPVIVSAQEALVEVCQDAALVVSGRDEAQLADRMLDLVNSDSLRTSLAVAGAARATLYTWRATVERLVAMLESPPK